MDRDRLKKLIFVVAQRHENIRGMTEPAFRAWLPGFILFLYARTGEKFDESTPIFLLLNTFLISVDELPTDLERFAPDPPKDLDWNKRQ